MRGEGIFNTISLFREKSAKNNYRSSPSFLPLNISLPLKGEQEEESQAHQLPLSLSLSSNMRGSLAVASLSPRCSR